MTVAPQPVPASDGSPPPPTVLEWGPPAPRRFTRWRRFDPRIGSVVAGLGAVALFGSLVGDWQVVTEPEAWYPGDGSGGPVTRELGLTMLISWGAGWLVGVMLFATCAGLALVGPPVLRAGARTTGLIGAGVLLAFLAAATVRLGQESLFFGLWHEGGLELDYGHGLYAGYAGISLVAVALWLARPSAAGGAPHHLEPAGGGAPDEPTGPPDLSVGPAEPFVAPDPPAEGR